MWCMPPHKFRRRSVLVARVVTIVMLVATERIQQNANRIFLDASLPAIAETPTAPALVACKVMARPKVTARPTVSVHNAIVPVIAEAHTAAAAVAHQCQLAFDGGLLLGGCQWHCLAAASGSALASSANSADIAAIAMVKVVVFNIIDVPIWVDADEQRALATRRFCSKCAAPWAIMVVVADVE